MDGEKDAMNIPLVSSAVGLALTLSGGGYWVSEQLSSKAGKEQLMVVELKADFVMDKQIESMHSQINKIESKPKKSEDDREQVRYLRDEVKRLRDIRQQR